MAVLVSMTRRIDLFAGAAKSCDIYLDGPCPGTLRLQIAYSDDLIVEGFESWPSEVSRTDVRFFTRDDIGNDLKCVELKIHPTGGSARAGAKLGGLIVRSYKPGMYVARPIEVEVAGRRYSGTPARFIVKEPEIVGVKLRWKTDS